MSRCNELWFTLASTKGCAVGAPVKTQSRESTLLQSRLFMPCDAGIQAGTTPESRMSGELAR